MLAGAGRAAASPAREQYDLVHTPVLFVEGGPSDMAYDGAGEGYAAISKLKVPVLWFSKAFGHGGNLSSARGGDFTNRRTFRSWRSSLRGLHVGDREVDGSTSPSGLY
jgi:hypothetical protein